MPGRAAFWNANDDGEVQLDSANVQPGRAGESPAQSGQGVMKLRICRDKTLASETILCIQISGREYYAWIEGSPAIGYRPHFSQSLLGVWWQLDRWGSYS